MAGILPISQVSSIPSCVQFASERIPLEKVLNLQHPNLKDPESKDKRTWRDGMQTPSNSSAPPVTWTAMDIMTSFADSKGWVTAKAGRPDVNRAGNASK